MSRLHNFAAGPAVLPVPVLEQLQSVLTEYGDTGVGLMEMSHRSKAFGEIIDSARARMRRLMGVPDDYEVLFLQGGASLQFYMSALNLTAPGERVDFINTGAWSTKAIKEAKRVCDAQEIWTGKADTFDHIPTTGDYQVHDDAAYVLYTANNTIYGTEWHQLPEVGSHHLVADLSSDICSRPFDVASHDVIFAGAQKNLGPSGVTAVILSPWAIERSRTVGAARPGGLPSMLDYGLMVDKGSMFNTPNTFGIFALERVLAWLEDMGGLEVMGQRNADKAALLYAELDRSAMWQPHARPDSRSLMNVTWRVADPDLAPIFVAEAADQGLMSLKGHRSVGGLRASIYNACPVQSVQALVDFMGDFERRHG